MSTKSIRLDEKLVVEAAKVGAIQKRSPAKQIEYWAEIGRKVENDCCNFPLTAQEKAMLSDRFGCKP